MVGESKDLLVLLTRCWHLTNQDTVTSLVEIPSTVEGVSLGDHRCTTMNCFFYLYVGVTRNSTTILTVVTVGIYISQRGSRVGRLPYHAKTVLSAWFSTTDWSLQSCSIADDNDNKGEGQQCTRSRRIDAVECGFFVYSCMVKVLPLSPFSK